MHRVPHEDGRRRRQEVSEYGTTTGALLALAGTAALPGGDPGGDGGHQRLLEAGVLPAGGRGFECWLVNARDVKNVPGRPKTDKLDAVWLASWPSGGCCRPSFVPPRRSGELRDLTRYRADLIRERTAEKQRAEKLLEDAQIKLSSVATDIFGVSGRAMLEALVAGQRDPRSWRAWPAAGCAPRPPLPRRSPATSPPTTPSCSACCWTPSTADRPDRGHARIEEQIAPYARAVEQLDEIAGVGVTSAQELIAEIGVDMTRFPTAGHLVSWAKFAPLDRSQPGRPRPAPPARATPGSPASSARSPPRRPDRHVPRRALPPPRPPPRQETRPGRRRQLHPHHHLAPAIRTRRPVP